MTNKEVFNGYQAEQFLKKFISISKSQLVKAHTEIKIKPPLVLKIISDQALHKTEIGGVKIIKTKQEIMPAFNELITKARKHKLDLKGILVQEFIEGEQLIIGINRDPVFGHIILFGLGGIFTEVLEDTSIRKCPITENDAQEMIDELKARKIFYGFRGKKLNLPALKKTLVQISKVPTKYKTLKEMDINPYILNEKTGVPVDARISFE